MAPSRVVSTCQQCRRSKLRCDRTRPECTRCLKAGRQCVYISTQNTSSSTSSRRTPNYPGKSPGAVELDPSHAPGVDPRLSHIANGISQYNHHGSFISISTNALPPVSANSSDTYLEDCERCVPRTRNRTILSCKRCRRLKVRCDRGHPCGRCSKMGIGNNCTYAKLAPSANSTTRPECSGDQSEENAKFLWRNKARTDAHWTSMFEEIKSLLSRYGWCSHHQHSQKKEFETASVNYPFGDTALSKSSHKTLLAYIPPRPIADAFVANYLHVVERSHQIMHVPTFKAELEAFWEQPSSADNDWLALLFAVLALGSQKYTPMPTSASRKDMSTEHPSSAQLLKAAETYLKQTPFMSRPSLTNIRTLCLIVTFKQLSVFSCDELDACWSMTGLITRLAISLGLHNQQTSHDISLSPFKVQERRILWDAIICMEIRLSLLTGMPLLLRPEDLNYPAPANINDVDISPDLSSQILGRGLQKTDATLSVLMHTAAPLIAEVLNLSNSEHSSLDYNQALEYEDRFRRLLQDSKWMLRPSVESDYVSSNDDVENTESPGKVEYVKINTILRRTMLALHNRFAKHHQASTKYPVSYWSSMECCLALLAQQCELCEQPSGKNQSHLSWFAGFFRQDSFTAAMTLCFHLVREDVPLEESKSCICQAKAKETVLETLKSCKEIWEGEKDTSMCHSRAFDILDALTRVLGKSDNPAQEQLSPGVNLEH